MRAVPAALQTHLDSGATTLARCWRVSRGDGVVQGFTEHDRDLSFGGVTYRAASGFAGSAIEAKTGLGVGDQEIAGVLSDDGIDAGALEAGLYDGAAVATWLVNWRDVAQRVLLSMAEIGEVRREGAAFRAELRSLASRLNVSVGRTFQPVCDARLGDARCGVDMMDATHRGEGSVVSSVDGLRVTVSGFEAFDDGWGAHGQLAWLSGANAGLTAEVRGFAGGVVTLWQPAPRAILAGDALRLTAGCDKRYATCRDRFSNQLNFRGFPAMPGNDWVASYPASGEAHDGGRRVS